MEHTIHCPGCAKPLNVPAEALAQPMACPHCRSRIRVPLNDDGTLGTPEKVERRWKMPEILLAPMFLLIMLGLAGTASNGYLMARFYTKPGSDLEYARGRVGEVNWTEALTTIGSKEQIPVDGLSMVGGTIVPASKDELLAHAWAGRMKRLHEISTGISVIVFVGGVCILTGRFYWLALLGCVAAMLNVNNLCCLPGGIAGFWGILVLVRDDARIYFGITPKVKPSSTG